MLKPVGFWSYTKADDTNSRGRITQLRGLLEAELQQRVGRATEMLIFQDLDGIQLGSDWEHRIRTALEGATFFIPIVTPAFLCSEWCCRETMLFHEREKALNRDDLIFPVHFVSVDHISAAQPAPDECQDPAVLALLRTRQWLDYRRLRLLNPDSTEIAIQLEKLAGAIFTTVRLERPPPRPPKIRAVPAPPPASTPAAPVPVPAVVPAAPTVAAAAAVPLQSAPPAVVAAPKELAFPSILLAIVIGLASAAGIGGVWIYMRSGSTGATVGVSPPATTPPPAVTATPPNSDAGAPSAADDFNAGRYAAAFAKYLYAAQHDDSNAQYQLGVMSQAGQGTTINPSAALEWYKMAAAADNPLAQQRLGYMYQNAAGVPQNYQEAVHWYLLAAEHGQKEAQSNLGYMYLHGQGVQRDPATAEHWFLQAAAQHAPGAEYQLGLMSEQGQLHGVDTTEAIRWYNAAAAHVHPNSAALYRLGLLAAAGKNIPPNSARAWMQKAEAAGNSDARQWLQSHR